MRVEVLDPAHEDMLAATWFYERQEQGLGAYFPIRCMVKSNRWGFMPAFIRGGMIFT